VFTDIPASVGCRQFRKRVDSFTLVTVMIDPYLTGHSNAPPFPYQVSATEQAPLHHHSVKAARCSFARSWESRKFSGLQNGDNFAAGAERGSNLLRRLRP